MVQAVIHPEDKDLYRNAAQGLRLLPPVHGAQTRQGSARAGLEALAPHAPDIVLVHDAARPFVSPALITRAIEAARATGAAIPVLAVSDTVKIIDATGAVVSTVDRATVRTVQTPQAFSFDPLLEAHRFAQRAGREDFTDDASLMEWAGRKVTTFEGDMNNVKLTTEDDFNRAELLRHAALTDVRTGFGFDVHPFTEGDHVTLGGVRIAHDRALAGHSDADVVLHASSTRSWARSPRAISALIFPPAIHNGAAHPPTDSLPSPSNAFSPAVDDWRMWTSRSSARHPALARIGMPSEAELQRSRASRCRVGLKATTSEKMGFTGRGEGMAVFATATVRLPWSG